ncbi:MAG: hypothetical protein U9Q81_24300 [Pseudomonadota bacterium]|nr:hypothetical protein [Pseudomonadota bacterium]
MSVNELLGDLLGRLHGSGKDRLLIGHDEVRDWPDGALVALMKVGLVAPTEPAETLICDGCEEGCPMPVHIVPGSRARAFISCDKRDDTARVPVALERLQQWQMSEAAVARALLAASDDHGLTEREIRDNLHQLPLRRLISFEAGQLLVDTERLLQHLSPYAEQVPRNRIVLGGDHWTITYLGRIGIFTNTVGMRYIAYLMQHQGEEILVSDLYYAIKPREPGTADPVHSPMSEAQLGEMGLSVGDLGHAGDVLTPEGKQRLEADVRRIQDRIDDAVELGDQEKQAELEAQQEEILRHIATQSGLGGRTRKASSAIEKIRTSVTKRIKADIKKISKTIPDLGRHLDQAIHTGTHCQYSPHPRVDWLFSSPERLS